MLARSLFLTAPRRLEWVARELPPLGLDMVLIETTAGAISIGAELPQYIGVARHVAPPAYPAMTGYESLGRVLAVGDAVERLRPGQRVFACYGHRTHAVAPAVKAVAVPDDIADAVALLAILSCDVMKGVRKLPRGRASRRW